VSSPGPSSDGGSLLLVDVEVEGVPGQCVEVRDGIIAHVGPVDGRRPPAGGRVAAEIDGGGGALLPGLNDHHLHLFSLAARRRSIECGAPTVRGRSDLALVLGSAAARARPGEWLRFVGHDETVVGPLDAPTLDELLGTLADRPIRVQHRSGHQWVLNSAAVTLVREVLGDEGLDALGPEARRGVLHGADEAVRAAWGSDAWPSLADVGAELAHYGVTGLTDATVSTGVEEVAEFEVAQAAGDLPQRMCVLGDLAPTRHGDRLVRGPSKIVLAEADLPSLDELAARVIDAGPRGVALHCVSRESLVLATAALGRADGGGHRVEHGSVAPPELISLVAALPVTVVTQPAFVVAHGDRYLREVDPADRPWLYRLAAWRAAGVPLAASSDAPFGPLDPWAAMRSAVERRTGSGVPLGPGEALEPEDALGLYLGSLEDPGGPRRRVVEGAPADLCLLQTGWAEAREALEAELVRATVCGGLVVHGG
jgi:predicted amidohydrolase YtcJ